MDDSGTLLRKSISPEESIPRIAVPPIGLTKKYPELGTGPVSTDIYHDPAIYQKELEAIFKRSWYMICRVEDVPAPGDLCDVLKAHDEEQKSPC